MIDTRFFTDEGLDLETKLVYFDHNEEKDEIRVRLIEYLDNHGIYQVKAIAMKAKVAIVYYKSETPIRHLNSFEALVDHIHHAVNYVDFIKLRMGIHFYNNHEAIMFIVQRYPSMGAVKAPQAVWAAREAAYAG